MRKAEFSKPEGPDPGKSRAPDSTSLGEGGDDDRDWAKLGVKEYAEQRFKWTEGKLKSRTNVEEKKQKKV